MPVPRFENPVELSRHLEECSVAVRRFVAGGPVPSFPGLFPGATTYSWVEQLPEYDPLRESLLRAVVRLTHMRIAVPFLAHERELLHVKNVAIREPVDVRIAPAQLRLELLGSRGEERRSWIRGWASIEQELSDHRQRTWEMVREVGERLGVSDLLHFWDPVEDGEEDSLVKVAEELVSDLRDAAENFTRPGWAGLVEALCADEAENGWPARLAPDTLRDLFGRRGEFRDVWLDPGPLPQRLCPASFLRAASQVGRALSDALRPRDQPAVVARDQDNLLGHKYAGMFYLWCLSEPFQKKRLGLSGKSREVTRRALRISLLAQVRLEAARYLVFVDACRSGGALLGAFGERTEALLLGEELPSSAVLSRFAVRFDQAARFAGLLAAAAAVQRATEEHDEDWLENPRAGQEMRAELHVPAVTTLPFATYREGQRYLVELAQDQQ